MRLAALFIPVLVAVDGCEKREARRESAVDASAAPSSRPAPARSDRGEACADVGEVRACWGKELEGEGCAGGVCLVPRPLPKARAPLGWRCVGQREARTCVDRSLLAGPWACQGSGGARSCVQDHPRLPDDGEWECVEISGIVYCHGGASPAGVKAGPPEPGWFCGARRGASGERICVDPSPDLPEPGGSWRCSFTYAPTIRRSCTTDERARSAGGECGEPPRCPRSTRCAGGRCLPEKPAPACWLDPDCGDEEACVLGSCVRKAG